ncbi:MAG: hypothetical protein HYY59_06225 [Candidatus Omnitrophica bacterium]|nr:hypothetical protein [Candidatus Omnitrophota bacterium]
MREQLEKLRASDPEKAKEVELTMREGERCMLAFEAGERYTPSTEMVAHAQEMFGDWEKDMIAQGAPPEFVERAKLEFAAWSGGEHTMGFGGPGQEFAGRAGPPTTEQMQAMGMTPDQIQAAMAQQQYIEIGSSGHMPTLEQMQAMGMTPDQIQAAQQYEASGNFGVNPSTGGWEPNMGGTAYTTGGWESTYSGGTTHWEGGSNYGINPATGGWEPGMGGAVYTGGETWTSGGTTDQWSNTTEQRQDLQTTTTTAAQEVHENAIHLHGDVEHVHDIHVHTDSTRHDHTATSPADTAPNSVFQ